MITSYLYGWEWPEPSESEHQELASTQNHADTGAYGLITFTANGVDVLCKYSKQTAKELCPF